MAKVLKARAKLAVGAVVKHQLVAHVQGWTVPTDPFRDLLAPVQLPLHIQASTGMGLLPPSTADHGCTP